MILSVRPDNLGLAASQECFLMIIKWACAWPSTLLGCKSVPQSVDDHKALGKKQENKVNNTVFKNMVLGSVGQSQDLGLSMPLPF